MKKNKIKILAIAAVVLIAVLVIVYLFTSYRGPDGLTSKEARMIEKYGASEITKEELEKAIDLDEYNDAVAFYESEPSFGEKVKYVLGGSDGGSKKADKAESSKQETNDNKSDNESDKAADKDTGDSSDKNDSSSSNSNSSSSENSSSDSSSGGNNSGSSSSDGSSNGGSSSGSGEMTYEKYISMSPEDQQAYFESYSSPDAFFKWFNAAKAEYDKNNDAIEVEGGNIDIGDYMDEE